MSRDNKIVAKDKLQAARVNNYYTKKVGGGMVEVKESNLPGNVPSSQSQGKFNGSTKNNN